MLALIIYMLFGLALAFRLLPDLRLPVRCWLGLVFGCAALMWLPCLAAFIWGFTWPAQLAALIFAWVVTLALAVAAWWRRKEPLRWRELRLPTLSRSDLTGLFASLCATLFCGWLLHTHVLMPMEDGSLWVGQSTYGDLGMHLGFAESMFRQGFFPPEYSIFPGQQLNYPFLVDAATGSLRFFGLSLRMAVILPSLIMLLCVFWGFWLLADKLTERLGATLMSWLLFTCNGGFGFTHFTGDTMKKGNFYIISTVEPETTGMQSVKGIATANAMLYNLQGLRVGTPTAGQIYISGGRKFIYHAEESQTLPAMPVMTRATNDIEDGDQVPFLPGEAGNEDGF